jgi:hypothetical protein
MQKQFPDVSKAEWLAKVEKDLRGKEVATLSFEVVGQRFSPLHHQEDLNNPPQPLLCNTDCQLGVFIEVTDPVVANQLALEALMGGANYLYFYDPMYAKGKAGYQEQLYAGILTDIVDVVWHNRPFQLGINDVDTIGQELHHFSKNAESTTIWLSPGREYLTNIAFFRAVRGCADLIVEHKPELAGYQLGVIIEGDKTDPNTAKIRTTAHSMAAVIGGADILMIKPSDESGQTVFERRIARNVHHLLTEESYLGQVADPAAGSYYLETLTNHLAQKIWTDFQHLSNEDSNASNKNVDNTSDNGNSV